jgi:hypothetical protein
VRPPEATGNIRRDQVMVGKIVTIDREAAAIRETITVIDGA